MPQEFAEKRNTYEQSSTLYKRSVIKLGYPTQNLTLPATTNRTLRLANLSNVRKIRGLIQENIEDLKRILLWNAERDIALFRMGQSLIPFASHPDFPYDWATEHSGDLSEVGVMARSYGIRLSMHPGQFIQPASQNPAVVERSLRELRYVARVFDLMGASDAVMVLHMGGAYGDKISTAARFIGGLRHEPDVLRYLALENDERVWSVQEISPISVALGVPIIVDAFHHVFNTGGLSLSEALDISIPSWKDNRPKLHLSSQDPKKRPGAHASTIAAADWELLLQALDGRKADIMIEAKSKELALENLETE